MGMPIAIVSERISEDCKRALTKIGFSVILCPSDPSLPAPISHHPDTLMAVLDGALFCPKEYYLKNTDFFRALSYPALYPLEEGYGASYPNDCAYNLLTIGKKAFYHPAALAPSLAEAVTARGYSAVPTRQGYTACTVCALGGSHAITADAGMAKKLSARGISVLKIESGSILLPPYEYGFIGGACGVYKETVYFLGDITAHPSYAAIKAFADSIGFALCSLSDETLCDLGGILFLEQSTDEHADGGNNQQTDKSEERIPGI